MSDSLMKVVLDGFGPKPAETAGRRLSQRTIREWNNVRGRVVIEFALQKHPRPRFPRLPASAHLRMEPRTPPVWQSPPPPDPAWRLHAASASERLTRIATCMCLVHRGARLACVQGRTGEHMRSRTPKDERPARGGLGVWGVGGGGEGGWRCGSCRRARRCAARERSARICGACVRAPRVGGYKVCEGFLTLHYRCVRGVCCMLF
jgi:hypothetical protein